MSTHIKLTRAMIQVTHDCDEILSEYRKQINEDIEQFVMADCDGGQVKTLLKAKLGDLEQKIANRLQKYAHFIGG